MSKCLVAYFSVSGVTRKVSSLLAETIGAALFEIVPVQPYTMADIDWTNKESRSILEMQDLACRPAVSQKVEKMEQYDTVFIGFPVWWGREPSVVDTFIDENSLCGKTIIPFCTSGGSPVDGSEARIKELLCGKAEVKAGKRLPADLTAEEIRNWICM